MWCNRQKTDIKVAKTGLPVNSMGTIEKSDQERDKKGKGVGNELKLLKYVLSMYENGLM